MYIAGKNIFGNIAMNSAADLSIPTKLKIPVPVRMVHTGTLDQVFYIVRSNVTNMHITIILGCNVYAIGKNEYGVLGTSLGKYEHLPHLVPYPGVLNDARRIYVASHVACNDMFSVIVLEKHCGAPLFTECSRYPSDVIFTKQ